MSQFDSWSPGTLHEACQGKPGSSEKGTLIFWIKEREAGVTARGVSGLPIHEKVIGGLYCDVCGAVFFGRERGQALATYCENLRKEDFQSPADKPTACPHCPVDKGQLVEAYLTDHFDNFSADIRPHGKSYLLCKRCGRLAWAFDHSAKKNRLQQEQLERDFAPLAASIARRTTS
ncbi:MAG: hypothetical protein WAZ14_00140 [Patescibacteria group bacterium]